MKSEQELIDRMNNPGREIPINRKPSLQESTNSEAPMDPCDEDPCENCELTDCPSHPLHNVPEQESKKVTEEEKSEIKDLIEKSKALFNTAFSQTKGKIEDFRRDNNLMDEDLILRWKEYRERVEKWIEKHKKFPREIAQAMLLGEYEHENERESDDANTLPWNEKAFKDIVDQMFSLYHRKNADYGDSFAKSFEKFGMQSTLMRLTDKYNRLESLTTGNNVRLVENESIEDTLLDIANYAIMTLIAIRDQARKK
jgi:hypothetical protein